MTLRGPLGTELDLARIGRTSWKAYAVRFLVGGTITALTGLIAHRYGPVVGGLFLAFPAILPASATLVDKHDGQRAAGATTLGAVIGSLALAAFGAVVWALGAHLAAWQVLAFALLVWLGVAFGLWAAFELARRADHGSAQDGSKPTAHASHARGADSHLSS